MQNDFRGGNIPIVRCLETGLGRCQWNLEQLSREIPQAHEATVGRYPKGTLIPARHERLRHHDDRVHGVDTFAVGIIAKEGRKIRQAEQNYRRR